MALMSFREREVAFELPAFVEYLELSGVRGLQRPVHRQRRRSRRSTLVRPGAVVGDRSIMRRDAGAPDRPSSRPAPPWRSSRAAPSRSTRRPRRPARLGRRRARHLERPAHDAARDRAGGRGEAAGAASPVRPGDRRLRRLRHRRPARRGARAVPGRASRRGPLLPVVRGGALRAVRRRHRHLLPHRLARHELGSRRDQGPRPRPLPVARRTPTSATSRASCSCASTPTPSARRRRARSPSTWASRSRSTTSASSPSRTCCPLDGGRARGAEGVALREGEIDDVRA